MGVRLPSPFAARRTPDGPLVPPRIQVGDAIAAAIDLYRLLLRRSLATAAVVYAAIAVVGLAHHAAHGALAQVLAVLSFLLEEAGPLLVQGALVVIVRNVHEGERPEPIAALYQTARGRFWPLFGASLLYVLGVVVGLLLLVVPGVVVAARWALLAPLIVLEGRSIGEARRRSSELVKGQTLRVFACVELVFVVNVAVGLVLLVANVSFAGHTLIWFAWSVATAPFQAHLLTVVYYRLADPDRPVVDPRVRGWRSVWEGR